MSKFTMETRKGPITEEEALDSDLDVLPSLSEMQHLSDFRDQLSQQRQQIYLVVSRHLGIPKTCFDLSEEVEWISGGFNICLPIRIKNPGYLKLPKQVLMRFPLPFNVGESFSPGSVDEKLRCEAATYVWLRENCPHVPIPRLLGMGFPGTQSFTALENESLWNSMVWLLRRGVAWWHGKNIAPYFAHSRESFLKHGYLLIEYVEHGKMLSTSWKNLHHEEKRRMNLYRGLARVMLDMANVPLHRIGSWTMNDQGTLTLTNRPLSDLTFFWNKHQIPTGVSRETTYRSAEPFILDTLAYQDLRLRHQPNAILSKNDGIFQLSAMTALRALVSRFWRQSSHDESFVFAFHDLHQSNIFVDDDWNITSLIDLEFASSRPVQMVRVPSWLSGRGVDELDGPNLVEYRNLYHQFVDIVEAEELVRHQPTTYSQRLREDWQTGRVWYTMALDSLNAFPTIFEQHLQPKFFQTFELDSEGLSLAQLWDENVLAFIDEKLEHNKQYCRQIHEIFARSEKRQVESNVTSPPRSAEEEA